MNQPDNYKKSINTNLLNKFRWGLLLVTMACSLSSCDPAKQIIIKNKTNEPARFAWKARVYMDSTFNRQVFELGVTNNDKKKKVYFGIGPWSDTEIDSLVNNHIQSIEIESINEKRIITDKDQMKKFLLLRRKGMLKNLIKIDLK